MPRPALYHTLAVLNCTYNIDCGPKMASAGVDFSHFYGSGELADVQLILSIPCSDEDCAWSFEMSASPDAKVYNSSSRSSDGSDASAETAAASPSPPLRDAVMADCCDGDAAPPKQQQQQHQAARCRGRVEVAALPAHRLVLQASSEWARASLSPEWAGGKGAGSAATALPALELRLDDAAEAAAAELLLRALYSTADMAAPRRGAGQEALLRVMRLADRLSAPAAEAAAARALAAEGELAWATVEALFSLPPLRAAAPAAAPLLAAARDALHARFGDLDAALADAGAREELLALPFAAIAALLADGRTRAGSENTAVFVAAEWVARHHHGHQGGGGGGGCTGSASGGTADEADEGAALAAALRAPHATPLFLASVAARVPPLSRHVPAGDLLLAAAFAGQPERVRATLLTDKDSPLARRAAWRLPPRPASRVWEATVAWDVPLRELRRLHEAALRGAPGASPAEALCPEPVPFQGLWWAIEVSAERDAASGGVVFGAFVQPRLPGRGATAAAASGDAKSGAGGGSGSGSGSSSAAEAEARDSAAAVAAAPAGPYDASAATTAATDAPAAGGGSGGNSAAAPLAPVGATVCANVRVEVGAGRARGFARFTFSGRVCWGYRDVFGLGPRAGAFDEEAWRAAGLVGDDGRVRVAATIKDVA